MTSFPLAPTHQVTNMDMEKQNNMCIFIVHDIYINSNQITFEIGINNDGPLEPYMKT
jgi:hypothetical protein